jgi:hypothetical protein
MSMVVFRRNSDPSIARDRREFQLFTVPMVCQRGDEQVELQLDPTPALVLEFASAM